MAKLAAYKIFIRTEREEDMSGHVKSKQTPLATLELKFDLLVKDLNLLTRPQIRVLVMRRNRRRRRS
jgi:hypothetical protein